MFLDNHKQSRQRPISLQKLLRQSASPRNAQPGFSLVEVLISIIIFSFGLLGMVGLQATALQSNRDARLQSSAVVLARELAEMMRVNRDVAFRATNNPYLLAGTSPLAATSPSYCLNASGSTPCADNVAVANAQMTDWLARLDSELPGARVAVCDDSAPFTAGVATWTCTEVSGSRATVIKIGWSRSSTNRSSTGADAINKAERPSLVVPVTGRGAL